MPDTHGPVEAGPESETAVAPARAPEVELAPEEVGADLDVSLELGLAGAGFPAATRAGAGQTMPPGLHARAIGRVQRRQGNFATQRMLQRAPVQRALPGPGHKGPVDHNGVTPPEIAALKNEETVWSKFKELYTKDGKAGINVFIHNTNIELATCAPEDIEPIRGILRSQQDRIDLYGERFIGTFEGNGRAAITELLAASDAAIKQEMDKYGINEKFAEDPELKAEVGTGEYTMNKDPKTDEMAAAAKQLAAEHKKLADFESKAQKPSDPNDSNASVPYYQVMEKLRDPEYLAAVQKYQQLFASTAAKFPVLAAFKDDPDQMASIGEKGASPDTATLIAKNLLEKRKNIKETQDNLEGGKLSVWSLPNVIAGTKTKMHLAAGSFEAKIVDEYKSDKDTSEMVKKIALGAIGAALGIISAVATAGGSLVIAAGAAGAGAVISTEQLMESVQDYQVTSAAANTDMDKAKAVSQSDASLFWVAVDLIAAGMDLAAAGAAFKAMAAPIHAAIEAKIAAKTVLTAEKTGQETAEAAKLANAVDEVEKAAHGAAVPEKATAQIKAEVQGELKAQIVDPDNPLSSAGFKGTLAEKGKGFGVYEAYIPGVKDKVVVKVYPTEMGAQFETELKGAEATGKTGIGPKCYGEVSVGEGKRAFAMEKVQGSLPEVVDDLEKEIQAAKAAGDQAKEAELEAKLAKSTAEAAETASKINQVTIQDVRAYGNRLLDQGFYVHGDLQGLVDSGGRWRPIDFQAHLPLPDKMADPAACADAMRMHSGQIEDQVRHLMAEGPKPLPNAPVGTLPPYNLPPKPVQPFRRGRATVQSTDDDEDWLAQRIESASGGGQPLEPGTQARLEAGLSDNLSDVRVHTGTDAAALVGAVDAVAFTSGRDIFFGPGTYQPGTSEGLELLAHEAAHTVQQAAGPVAGTAADGGILLSDPQDDFERAAEQASREIVPGAGRVFEQAEAASGFDLSATELKPASDLAAATGVEALTYGAEVHLAPDTPTPETPYGAHVLAHELAHVVQQGQGQVATLDRYPGLELEAEAQADQTISTMPGNAGLRALPETSTPAPQAFDPRYHRQSLVEGMGGSGFSADEIGAMYAANWERDFSQAHPALGAVVLAWKAVKLAAAQSRLTQTEIDQFNGAVNNVVAMIPFQIKELQEGKAYGGYSFFEHMDNPTGDPNMASATREALLRTPPGESIPQYMIDSREYMKAQLFRAASEYRGDMSDTSTSGQTAANWEKRKKELEALHQPDKPGTPSQSAAPIVGPETAAEVNRNPVIVLPEMVVVGTPPGASGADADIGDAAQGGQPGAPAALPTSGPAFNTEVDRRFWQQTSYKVGQRLDPKLPEDQPFVQIWLRLRDQVRTEREARNAEIARAREKAARGPNGANPGGGGTAADTPPTTAAGRPGTFSANVADAMGRASHALEDFFSHSNFVEIAIGEATPTASLATGTFTEADTSHALSHKIRGAADEIDAELPLVNRVAGRTTANPSPEEVTLGDTTPPVKDKEDVKSWWDVVGPDVPKDAAIGAGVGAGIGASIGLAAGPLGALAGGAVGGLVGGAIGGWMGLRPEVKEAITTIGASTLIGAAEGAAVGGPAGMILGGAEGLRSGIKDTARNVIATPAGVALLRRAAEMIENSSRDKAAPGSHTAMAKDQPSHDEDAFGRLKTIKFELAQQLAAAADRMVLGPMRQVFDAATPEAAEAQLQAVHKTLDTLITSPGAGHPLAAVIDRKRAEAINALEEYRQSQEHG